MQNTGTEIAVSGEAVRTASGHFELNNRVMARFAAIGIQEVVPSLQGSRLAIENLAQPLLRLGSGFGGLALGALGAAAALGVAAVKSWDLFFDSTLRATRGVRGLSEEIAKQEEALAADLPDLEKWNRLAQDTGKLTFGGPSGEAPEADLTGFARVQAGRTGERIRRRRSILEQLRGAQALEDPALAPGGAFAKAQQAAAEEAFRGLERSVLSFQRTSQAALIQDPLGKMLLATVHQAEDLGKAMTELGRAGGPIDAIDKLRVDLGAALRGQLEGQTGAFFREQGPGAALSLGLGESNLFAGFKGIRDIQADVRNFTGEITRLAKEGVPARDLFDAIGKAQEGLDKKVTDLNERFADQPAVLDKIRSSLGGLQFGGLSRDLDATVRGLQGLSTVAVSFETAIGSMPSTLASLNQSVVSVTGDVYALRDAFAAARFEAMLLGAAVGEGANLGPAPLAQ